MQHCVKSFFLIRSSSGPNLTRIWTAYVDFQSKSPYSVRMRENAYQQNPEYGYFSHSSSNFNDAAEQVLVRLSHPLEKVRPYLPKIFFKANKNFLKKVCFA